MKGTTPAGARSEQEAAAWVRGMFGRVAPRYDFANHLLSFNIDRYWRARTVARLRPVLEDPEARVLDVCCGTGDLVVALERARRAPVMGSDFCHPMLVAAGRKIARRPNPSPLFESDALALPLPDASLDLLTTAFGFRNLANYDAGLREIHRVLAPDGEVGILDFGEPRGLMGALYGFYFRYVLPAIGTWISGVHGPYTYLPASVHRFPAPDQMLDKLRHVGFHEARWVPYTFGIAGLYRGRK